MQAQDVLPPQSLGSKIILIIVHEMKCAKEAFEFPELLGGHI